MNLSNKIANRKATIWVAATLILLIAAFFRFYRLADHPLGIFFDPAINGLDAVWLMQRGGYVLFFPTNGGRESLFIYLLMPYLWLFGTTPFALRALTATIGLLTVALLIGFLYDLRFTIYDLRFTPLQHSLASSYGMKRLEQGDDLKTQTSRQTPQNGRFWLATLGGLALAVSYWHIAVSRLGVRPILVPLLAIPIFWFFLKGWRSDQKRWFVLSGCLMGLAGYTYPAARLLPVILLLALLPELFFIFRQHQSTLRATRHAPRVTPTQSPITNYQLLITNYQLPITNLLLFTLAALIIYTPMAWYLLTHPEQFTARAFSVMVWNFLDTPGQIMAEMGRNLLRVAGFFCCAGSPNPIFGWPGYPGLSFLVTPFLLIGLFVALKNWRDLFQRLIALWWLTGILPSIIAIEAPHPLRMIVAVAPTAILIALGAIHLSQWLADKVSGVRCQVSGVRCQVSGVTQYLTRFTFYAWLSIFLILLPTPSLFRAYFIDWTRLQTTQGVYDYGAVAIRETIFDLTAEEAPIYLPLARFNDSTLLFYLSGAFQRQAKRSISPAEQAFVIAPERNMQDAVWVRLHDGLATIIPPLTGEGQQIIQAALREDSSPIRTRSGEVAARLAQLPTDPARFLQQPTQPLTATFDAARLTGLAYPSEIDPLATEVPVTLFWQAIAPMADEYEIILHLVDDNRHSWGSGSGRPTDWVYPTSFWRPGLDDVAAQHILSIEAEALPPGRYWLAISLFDPAKGQRLPLTESDSDAPDTIFAGPLKIPLPPPEPQLATSMASSPPTTTGAVTFGQTVQLLGLSLGNTTVSAGQVINLNLLWEAQTQPKLDYTIFIHLLDADGSIVAGNDAQPLAGRYPTSIWSAGERILDPHTLPIPAGLSPGQYQLALGLYDQPSGERLPLTLADGRQNKERRLILPQAITVRSE